MHTAVEVTAKGPAGETLAQVTARLVPFSHGAAGQLHVPEVAGATTYEARLGGVNVSLDASSSELHGTH